MLPPGHIAGAYLTTSAILILTHPAVLPEQVMFLLLIGLFFGVAPDFDFFYGFAKTKSWTASEDKFDHRKYLSHAPILWLIPAVFVFLFASNPFWKEVGILILVGSWTHFILDSIEAGIMWLWPFQTKRYAFLAHEGKYITPEKRFFPFWIGFTRWYVTTFLTAKLEILLILIGCGVWLMNR